jgi:hypothetical protein
VRLARGVRVFSRTSVQHDRASGLVLFIVSLLSPRRMPCADDSDPVLRNLTKAHHQQTPQKRMTRDEDPLAAIFADEERLKIRRS